MNPVEILIADDHELFRRMVRSFIESQPGYRVCGEAGDGIEAVEKVRQLSPDIVLMDINMPRMDGLEATRIVRREMPDCNVIIVTQNHATIAREQARNVDAKGAITKSDLTQDLFFTIEKLLGRANPEPQNKAGDPGTAKEGWVRGGGALARLVQDFDWTTTPLGSSEQWPQSLKTVVRTMLTSRFAMWMSWGPELTFLYNDAYAKMTLGQKHPWALGKPSQKVWEEIWDDIGPRIRKVLETGEATWDEALMLFLERSGYREETYHTFSYSPLSGDDGKATGHLCVVTEETDRVIGERRLKTLRTLATELGKIITEEDVVSSVSRSLSENERDLPFALTYLVSENGKQARLACRTGIAAGHRGAPEIIDLADKNQAWPIGEILAGKDSVVVDDLMQRFDSVPSGDWDRPPARALLLPITSQTQGSPAGVLIAALNPYRPLDVNYAGFLNLLAGQIAASVANARAYEAEKQRAEALAEIDRAKTVFFSNVSHEFRTPLTLMLAPLEDMLAEPGGLAPHHQERLGIAHRNSLRLLKLVNTLLDFSRIEAGRFQASYEPTDLPQLTVELASVFRSAVERARLRLVVNCPSLEEPVYVDRELWEKIVFNLLSNAFKFTFDGEIEVSTQETNGGVELAVTDTGIGIPEDDLPHLFERFYRVKDARGRTFEGSGIGLALVQELAKQHGGTVRVKSEVGRGSTFTVTLPLGKDHLPADRIGAHRTLASTALRGESYVEEAVHWLPQVQQEIPSVSTLVPCGLLNLQAGEDRPRILLADDNSDMREYVRKLLSSSCDVKAVGDGVAALDVIREHPPDLILSDVMMPKLDGFGLLKEVRSDERAAGIPVILISARAGEESRVEGLSAGADDYLTKPFSARELLARVKSQLAMAKVRRQAAQLERELREHAEAEADGLAKMNEWGWRLWRSRDLIEGLNETLGAVIALLGADKGVLQLLDPQRRVLAIAAQRGFEQDFLDFFREVTADTDSSCGRALRKNERFIVEDIEQDGPFEPFRPVMRRAGVRSVVSIPLIVADGSVLGMLSAHFSRVHRPTEQDLRRLDLYIRQAADFIRRCRTDEALRRSEEQFRKLSETLDVEVRARTRALEQQSQQVRELSWRLLRSQDEERRHIARELHDSAGQTLTVLGINLAQVLQEAGRNAPEVAAKIEQIQETVQLLHREIRTTSYLLHPPLLDENGLYSAVSWYIQGLLERSGLDIRVDIPKDFGRLPPDMELVIFRLVQECLTNIHRHAESATALIRMARESNLLTIEIRDQGKGISPERLSEIQLRRSGVGIRGMRERLRQFDGTLNIESDGSGTRVIATIPVPKATSSEDENKAEPLQQPA
jgi:signal transduction histidine kinase/PAS domain-containing protein